MSETFTLYKLIVLYMLQKVDFPLTTAQISEFILDQGYTTYFTLQEALSEMVDSDLIQKEYDLKEEVAVKADFYENTKHEYEVRCQIVEEGYSIIDLKLIVPTKSEAEAIAENWDKKNQEIYTLLMTQLL